MTNGAHTVPGVGGQKSPAQPTKTEAKDKTVKTIHTFTFSVSARGMTALEEAEVLWEEQTDGDWVSLLLIPRMGYVITCRESSIREAKILGFEELGLDWINLGRPEAGRLAVALMSALIGNGEEIIADLIETAHPHLRDVSA